MPVGGGVGGGSAGGSGGTFGGSAGHGNKKGNHKMAGKDLIGGFNMGNREGIGAPIKTNYDGSGGKDFQVSSQGNSQDKSKYGQSGEKGIGKVPMKDQSYAGMRKDIKPKF